MCDYDISSQQTAWLYTPSLLAAVRSRANREARDALSSPPKASGGGRTDPSSAGVASSDGTAADAEPPTSNGGGGDEGLPVPVRWYASGYAASARKQPSPPTESDCSDGPWEVPGTAQPYLTPIEESLLVQFYASKLPDLIGPRARVPRLRRDAKVSATAALLFRRFFLSNSVMVHDPKAVMVASAFLGSKVEDETADVRYLEEGTKLMEAHVTVPEILSAEMHLLAGVRFELLCFHPYKAVLAYTEDLRTYLKSKSGRRMATFPSTDDGDDDGARTEEGSRRLVAGEDLRPMHDEARRIVDDAVVSDIPLLYSPGMVGLAALMVANDDLQTNYVERKGLYKEVEGARSPNPPPNVDLLGYVRSRFEDRNVEAHAAVEKQTNELVPMLRGLREGKFGCGNHGVDMDKLKGVHKKLKKCRSWGGGGKKKGKKDDGGKKKKKKKKRKASDGDGGEAPSDAKISKLS